MRIDTSASIESVIEGLLAPHQQQRTPRIVMRIGARDYSVPRYMTSMLVDFLAVIELSQRHGTVPTDSVRAGNAERRAAQQLSAARPIAD